MTTDSTRTMLGRLDGKVDQMMGTLDRVTDILLGDGQAGAVERLTRLEECVKETNQNVDSLAASVNSLQSQLSELNGIVKTHAVNQDTHSWRILLNRRILGGFALGFLVLHSLIDGVGMVEWKDILANLLKFLY